MEFSAAIDSSIGPTVVAKSPESVSHTIYTSYMKKSQVEPRKKTSFMYTVGKKRTVMRFT